MSKPSEDSSDIYTMLMLGAGGSFETVEAAYRLVYQVKSVLAWMIDRNFIHVRHTDTFSYAVVSFPDALSEIDATSQCAELGLTKSDVAVIWVAASLAGKDNASLRVCAQYLDEESTKHVVEAIMYASGYMDGEVNLHSELAAEGSIGPNRQAHDERFDLWFP